MAGAHPDENYLYTEPSPDIPLVDHSDSDSTRTPANGEDVLLNQLSGRLGSLQIAEDGRV